MVIHSVATGLDYLATLFSLSEVVLIFNFYRGCWLFLERQSASAGFPLWRITHFTRVGACAFPADNANQTGEGCRKAQRIHHIHHVEHADHA